MDNRKCNGRISMKVYNDLMAIWSRTEDNFNGWGATVLLTMACLRKTLKHSYVARMYGRINAETAQHHDTSDSLNRTS